MTTLRRWWVSKYQKSIKSREFKSYTIFELIVEFFEDFYAENKTEMWKEDRKKYGVALLPKTGDPLIDRWEDQIAKGLDPDLTEGMLPKDKNEHLQAVKELDDRIAERREAAEKAKMSRVFNKDDSRLKQEYAEELEFSDDYTKG